MKFRTIVTLLAILVFQINLLSSTEAAVVVPIKFEFSSSYGVDMTATLSNAKSNSIDVVPGDTVILELSAKIVDSQAVDWPTEVEFNETDFNLFNSPVIDKYRFMGFFVSAYIYCRSDENYFKGNNFSSADLEIPWNGSSGKKITKIKLPKVCNEMIFEFRVDPTVQEIILKGNSKVTGRGDLDYWFLTPETSDTQILGEIRNHINILRWTPVKNATLGMKKVKFTPKATAGKVTVMSLSKNVCVTSGDWILFARSGTCEIQISVDSTAGYDEVDSATYSFEILKSIELQCVKNDKLKLVKGSNPKCPPGFKKA